MTDPRDEALRSIDDVLREWSEGLTTAEEVAAQVAAIMAAQPSPRPLPRRRNVVQIAICDNDMALLCDDGTVWSGGQHAWRRMADVPQDEVALDGVVSDE